MAVPVFGDSSSGGSGAGTSRSVSAPATRSAGDTLVAGLYLYAPSTAVPIPDGWEPAGDTAQSTFRIRSYVRVATGDSADDITWSWTGSAFNGGAMVSLPGGHGSDPLDVVSLDATGNTDLLTIPSMDTTADETLLVPVWSTDSAPNFTPDGWTAHVSAPPAIGTLPGPAAAGPTGAVTGDFDAVEQWAAHMLAIAPPPDPPVAVTGWRSLLGVGR